MTNYPGRKNVAKPHPQKSPKKAVAVGLGAIGRFSKGVSDFRQRSLIGGVIHSLAWVSFQ